MWAGLQHTPRSWLCPVGTPLRFWEECLGLDPPHCGLTCWCSSLYRLLMLGVPCQSVIGLVPSSLFYTGRFL